MATYFTKSQGAVVDYSINWDDGYLSGGETLVSSGCDWAITPDGLGSTDDSVSGNSHVIWVNGGIHGVTYTLRSRVLTSLGRTDERYLYVKVWEDK